jgi:hypothetical protein
MFFHPAASGRRARRPGLANWQDKKGKTKDKTRQKATEYKTTNKAT